MGIHVLHDVLMPTQSFLKYKHKLNYLDQIIYICTSLIF